MTDWTALARDIADIMDGREDQLRAELTARHPAYMDQLAAAKADAGSRYTAYREGAARIAPDRYREADPRKASRTVLDGIYGLYLRMVAGVASGDVATCPHVSLRAPVPAVATVFADRVDCHACLGKRARPKLSAVEEHTCDLCRRYVPNQTMHMLSPQCGPLMLVTGICDTCRAGADPAHDANGDDTA